VPRCGPSALRPSQPFSQLRRLLRSGHSGSSADKVQVAPSCLERCNSPRASVLVAPNGRSHAHGRARHVRPDGTEREKRSKEIEFRLARPSLNGAPRHPPSSAAYLVSANRPAGPCAWRKPTSGSGLAANQQDLIHLREKNPALALLPMPLS
jgi:hypothetical protein